MSGTVSPSSPLLDKTGWTFHAALRAAGDRPDRICLRSMSGEELTYGQVIERSERRAAGFADLGVGVGDRVILLMDNSIEMLISWFAISLFGAVEVPANTAIRGRSLAHVVDNCGATVAVVDGHYAERLAELAAEVTKLRTVVVHGSAPDLPWPTHELARVSGDPSGLDPDPVTYRDPAAIIHTSGTTGPAKGVVVPHGDAYVFAMPVAE